MFFTADLFTTPLNCGLVFLSDHFKPKTLKMKRPLLLLMIFSWINLVGLAQSKTTSYSRGIAETGTAFSQYIDADLYPFYHGVASGDPLSDRVILWTRVTPEQGEGTINVTWAVALDPQMQQTVKEGSFTTDAARDYTVKVDVTGLSPETTYYYMFTAFGRNSLTGRTKTAPTQDDHLRFAVVSCSNYQDGYFSAYRRISERNDLDAVIHLGDYIYEYEEGDFGDFRPIEPKNEIVSLDDYRVRYSFYRMDPDLRAAHQQHPFITVWDDHEFANNAYKDGAENHQPDTEGDWNVRKNNAWQAYFEWMPVRESGDASNPYRIYRNIKYGNLLDVMMLDTRIEARDEQDTGLLTFAAQVGTELESAAAKSNHERSGYTAAIEKVLRKNLPLIIHVDEGKATEDHRSKGLSQEEFDFVVTQMARLATALEMDPENTANAEEDEALQQAVTLLRKAVKQETTTMEDRRASRKLLGDAQFQWLEAALAGSTAQWKILGNQVLFFPLNGLTLSDTWDGYKDDRERLLDFIDDHNIKNVALVTGDIHTTFASDLPKSATWYALGIKNSQAVEFVTPSITSSNLDEFINISDDFLNWVIEALNPHVKESNLNDHGYMVLDIDQNRIQTDWYYLQDVFEQNTPESFGQGWYVKDGEQRLRKASGPAPSHAAAMRTPAPATPMATATSYTHSGMVLLSAYPNPADEACGIHYILDNTQNVRAQLYDASGHLEMELMNEQKTAGNYLFQFNTQSLKEGMYIIKMRSGSNTVTRTIIVKH